MDTSNTAAAIAPEVTPEDELESFRGRLADWVQTQPEVASLDDLGDGFYGIDLKGCPDGVSMVVRMTNQQG